MGMIICRPRGGSQAQAGRARRFRRGAQQARDAGGSGRIMPPMRGMRWITAPGTLLLVGVMATGCGDNDSDAGLPGAAAVDQFAVGITEAFCSWQFRCCSMPELEIVQGGRFTNEAMCAQSGVPVA